MVRIPFLILAIAFLKPQMGLASKLDPSSIEYVGSVSINPSQEAKLLQDWYEKFGVHTEEMNFCAPKECIGYFGAFDTVAGPFYFAIHPRRADAPAKSSGSVEIVFRVSDYDSFLAKAAKNNVLPRSTDGDDSGRFAYFFDPDGNKITIWGK